MSKAQAASAAKTPAQSDQASEQDKNLPAPLQSANAVAAPTSSLDDLETYAGSGLENVRAKDLLIPRLTILQSLSPQLKTNKPEYIDGAAEGDICDVGLQELFKGSVLFIPVYFMTQYLEWLPNRKGLAGIHNDPEILSRTTVNDKRQNVLSNGNIVSETAQFYGLNANADYRFSFIPMTSTQLKKARRWNTLASSEKVMGRNGEFTPPLFYRSYVLSTIAESNDQGDWRGWKVERGPRIEEIEGAAQKVFELAKGFYDQLKAGRAKGDLESMQDEVTGDHTGGERRM